MGRTTVALVPASHSQGMMEDWDWVLEIGSGDWDRVS